MSNIVTCPVRVQHTGTTDRARAVEGLRLFVQGLTNRVSDWNVYTTKSDLYDAYLRWAGVNCPCFILGPNQFTGEFRAATAVRARTRYVPGAGQTTVFPFVTLHAEAA